MSPKNVFDLFHPVVADWFQQQYGEPSPPQQQGWPVIAAGNHSLILSPTGSGKTLAAFLWCIDELFRLSLTHPEKTFQKNLTGVHTLYVSPLKALNNDIHRNLQLPLRGITTQAREAGFKIPEIRVVVRTGDTPAAVRQSMLKKPPHILITTPESLYLLLTSPRGREIFRNVRYLIMDEIHALCSNKRGVHLSLSTERLMTLTITEPVRIGLSATQRPLRRIAAFLGGQKYFPESNLFKSRKVTLVECPQGKKMILQVLSPVDDFSDLSMPSVWPSVIQTLYDLILAHKTTLIFANMRAQSEKIARQLNELHRQRCQDPQAELAFPHHGSMSREMRFDIENRLKKGTLAAVVATASLELGIDIGSIDLVVQLEAPKSISGSLQRIGRSGHMLDQSSKGFIIPLYPSDLDDAAALSHSLEKGEIEETVIPENCLDILAQQVLAEVAMRDWSRLDLFNLFRQSYCYRHLSLSAFDNVLDMLAGRYADKKLPALQPRLVWDRVNDQLISRRGARLLAIMNGGTIPDRGYYTVILADSNVRLGEMEEEFVFESRIGDVFFLGNNEWWIDSIQRDRIIVTPVKAIKPRPPFWKGEIPSRDYETCLKVGIFRQWMTENLDHPDLEKELTSRYHLDSKSCKNLVNYITRQKAHTEVLPTHRQIVIEWFHDTVGDLTVLIHAPFGGRVNACWAMALSLALEKQYQIQIQWSYNDDGILLRLIDRVDFPALDPLFRFSVQEIGALLKEALTVSPLFAIQFRHNAARALLLERSKPAKRIPLWLQRLRAADLLQAVREYQDFPIILETYRSCLEDIFDLPALFSIIKKIRDGQIQIHIVNTLYPSPMASGLLFNLVSNQLYDRDHVRLSAEVSMVSSDLLAQILNSEHIPSLVTREIISTALSRWQHLHPDTRAADREDLYMIIEKFAPIGTEELQQRSKVSITDWLQDLQNQNRIRYLDHPLPGWVPESDHHLFTSPWSKEKIRSRLQKYLQNHGPLTSAEISSELNWEIARVEEGLGFLSKDRDVVRGKLIRESDEEYWCDRDNFAHLYRTAIASRRRTTMAINREQYFKFLLNWHGLSASPASLTALVEQYRGMRFPLYFFEREILTSRCTESIDQSYFNRLDEMKQLLASGDLHIRCLREGNDRTQVTYIFRGEGNLFFDPVLTPEFPGGSTDDARLLFQFLKENGASYFSDIGNGTGLPPHQTATGLQDLILAGLISCDDYDSFFTVLNFDPRSPLPESSAERPVQRSSPMSRITSVNRSHIRQRVKNHLQLKNGRWFLTTAFAVAGKSMGAEERVERQTRLLLKRHGILVKEWYRWENGFEPWYKIFQMLKRLEWQGEILRGYFVEGLSGIQFALPEAVSLLESIAREERKPVQTILLSTMDPALPFGRNTDWNIYDQNKNKMMITRIPGNHLIFISGKAVVYTENYATRLILLDGFKSAALPGAVLQLKNWLLLPAAFRPRKRIEIESINYINAAQSDLADELIKLGFEREDKKLVLWPSNYRTVR